MSWGKTPKKDEPALSKETQALLSGVMERRGLSLRAMEDVQKSLKSGDSNWVDHLNTGSSTYKAPASKTQTLVKAPKVGKAAMNPQSLALLPPSSFSGKRMLPDIMRITPPERDMFTGVAPGPDREAEKDRLSKVMEHGAKGARELERKMAEMKAAALERAARSKVVDVREEMIDLIVDEIRERREFLEQMRAAGKGQQYEAQIRGEIAGRMKELSMLGLDTKVGKPPPPPKNPNSLQLL
mmetsp:Transcript_26863/g.58615  ORF Transcript_26863/g.58615 Transcript_26863/m.58615 type:complete len:240 (+) Transcript_26863:207-926(+)|eukprot:CAMPEP_0202901498 /NCGR_PEP_ID=MMETSP1392-20130828/14285_1 /ASSEMBLY_ACC=CAM_ASM_000868 /TAXON_ID=225041 /ORGANISM="Chlamydomonas chlamydogama, Strain SAG 11-48b" /LENGTH=239 /DNA_ID=CAMNT_0049588061 /DNA_START=183 /DNA_END=902 /DNA_ORIENTATION=+